MVDLHQPMGVAPCEMWQNVKLPVISTNLMGLCLERIPMCVYNIATMYNYETPCMEICGFKKNVFKVLINMLTGTQLTNAFPLPRIFISILWPK